MQINKTLKIGITGGIGSGKSVISRILKTMGYPIYDSDSWAKKLMNENEEIRNFLTFKFGKETYTLTQLNRPFLAQKIFNNKENLAYVNSVVHPIVGKHFLQWSEQQNSSLVFIESAILFSSGFNKIVDKVIFVDAPQDVRLERAILRDNATTEAIMARIKNQEKGNIFAYNHSDFIIQNDNKILIIPQIVSVLKKIND
jgi:dephospho-CoA kinase